MASRGPLSVIVTVALAACGGDATTPTGTSGNPPGGKPGAMPGGSSRCSRRNGQAPGCRSNTALRRLGLDLSAAGAPLYELASVPSDAPGSTPTVWGVDATAVFFAAQAPSPSKRVSFRSLIQGDTTHRAVACDVASVRAASVDADAVYLLELRSAGDEAPETKVRKIARP